MTIREFLVRRAPGSPFILLFALLPFLPSCAAGERTAGERTEEEPAAGTDSVARGILDAIAAGPPPSASPGLSGEAQEAEPLDIAAMGYNRGKAEAPVKVLEISDFGCGYCRRFHEEIFPALNEAYVEAGLVEWKFIPFVLGMFPNGLEAAMAAECAGAQDRFFPMQSRLFADQSGWKNAEDPYPYFGNLAEEEGLEVARFNQCLHQGLVNSAVRANVRLGREIGVRGTPTFLIDGAPISGAIPVDTFRDILDIALSQKGVTPPERE